MLNAKVFAHAVTAVTGAFYVVCWMISVLAPDVIFSISQSWMHSINIESLKSTVPISTGTVLIGLITISALAWVTTYATIWLYNKWAK